VAVTINSNIASLRAQRLLSLSTDRLSKTSEKLASGLRINSASDDAAGLAIADSLRSQSRIATVAIRNANDGISALSIADGALAAISNVLQRMAELSEQSANGTYQNLQRSPIQGEFIALASEIERIATVTRFNNIGLLSGGSSLTLQVGFDSGSNSQLRLDAIVGTLAGIRLAPNGSSQLTYSVIASNEADSRQAALTALAAVTSAIETVSSTRGAVGAAESRLNVAVQNLQSARENINAAESRIRDVDVAVEAAELIRLQMLQKAGAAILTQANIQPNIAMKLLKA